MSNNRPSAVTIVIAILGGMAVYGLLFAARFAAIGVPLGFRPAFLAALLRLGASMGGSFGVLVTVLVLVFAAASAAVGYAAWKAWSGPHSNALEFAHRGAVAWTVSAALLTFAPWIFNQLAPSVSAATPTSGDLLSGVMGLGAPMLGDLSDLLSSMAIASLQSEFYIWFGVPTLLALYATLQLAKTPEVRRWFGARALPPPPGPVVIQVEPPPVAATMMPPVSAPIASLVRVQRGQLKEQHPITASASSRQIVIGRDARNAQIALQDDTVSRVHASIEVQNNRVYISDLNSAWGTSVNGRKLTQRQLLYHNDRIKLGDAEFVFVQGQQ